MHVRMLPHPQALQKVRGHHALGGTPVHGDGAVEAVGEGEGQGHRPEASNYCSGAGGREPWLEGVDDGHVPVSRGRCEWWVPSRQTSPDPLVPFPAPWLTTCREPAGLVLSHSHVGH